MYDKYELYESAVQSPEGDIEFIEGVYRRQRGKRPRILREDFCGTGKLACTWVEQNSERRAWAIDLDLRPIRYGMKRHYAALEPETRERLRYVEADVMRAYKVGADIVAALNFSYFIFKERETLKKYFSSVLESLRPGGMFVLDIFGGPDSQTVLEEKRRIPAGTYHWDCVSFNPINNHCKFAIHFTLKKSKTQSRKKFIKNAFRYDWRLWTIVELREILEEVGFRKSLLYWEGDDGHGGGNGEFKPREREENCESWVAYVVGLK